MASAIHHLRMLQLSHLQWHLAPIAWSHSLPWLLLPCKFKWQLTLLKFLFHCLLPLSDFIRAWGCWALEAQGSDGIPWGSRCNISKWVVTGQLQLLYDGEFIRAGEGGQFTIVAPPLPLPPPPHIAAFIRWRVHKDWGGGQFTIVAPLCPHPQYCMWRWSSLIYCHLWQGTAPLNILELPIGYMLWQAIAPPPILMGFGGTIWTGTSVQSKCLKFFVVSPKTV